MSREASSSIQELVVVVVVADTMPSAWHRFHRHFPKSKAYSYSGALWQKDVETPFVIALAVLNDDASWDMESSGSYSKEVAGMAVIDVAAVDERCALPVLHTSVALLLEY